MSHATDPEDWRAWRGREGDGGGPGPVEPEHAPSRSPGLAGLAERHWWVRVLLHAYIIVRYRRDVRWHWTCICREFHERFHPRSS